MVRIYPQLDETQLEAHHPPVEAVVYRALRDNGPPDWLIFFNLRFVKQVNGLPRAHAEVDFLVFAPEFGVLVVEVKGGVLEVDDASNTWTRLDDRGRKHVAKDPMQQVLSAQKGITAAMRGEMAWNHAEPHRLLRGTALLFPDIDRVEDLAGPSRPVETLGGKAALGAIAEWLRAVFLYWGKDDAEWRPLGQAGMQAAERLFGKRTLVPRPLAHVIAVEHARQLELTQQQAQILKMLKYTSRALISGAAGTGKTLLALEQAQSYASQGLRTLFVCYNRALSDFLARTCSDIKNLDPLTFDMLIARRLADLKRATGEDPMIRARVERPDEDSQEGLRTYALIRATEMLSFRYQAIVVDEGQDFAPEAFLAFRRLLEDRSNSPWLIFFDPNQAIYRTAPAMPDIGGGTYPLTINCRSTNYIHRAAHSFFSGSDAAECLQAVTGDPLVLLHADGLARQAALVRSTVEELITTHMIAPVDVTVLVAGDPKDRFFEALSAAGTPAAVTWGFERHWQASSVAVDTVRRFKGLEAVAIVLWGLEYAPTDIATEIMYVALSRARSRVWVVGHADRIRSTLRRCAVNLDGLESLLTMSEAPTKEN